MVSGKVRMRVASGFVALAALATPVASTWVGDVRSLQKLAESNVKAARSVTIVSSMNARGLGHSDTSDWIHWSDIDWSDYWSDFDWSDFDWSDYDWSDWSWSDWGSGNWTWSDIQWSDYWSDIEFPPWYYEVSYACLVDFSSAFSMGSDYYSDYYSDYHFSDASYSDDYGSDFGPPQEVLDKCGLTEADIEEFGMIFSSDERDGLCDPNGSLDDYGEQCIDLKNALEAMMCVTLEMVMPIIAPLQEAINGAEACTADERDMISDWYVEEILAMVNPVNMIKEECGESNLHPCIAPGGPIDLQALADSYSEAVSESVASTDDGTLGSDLLSDSAYAVSTLAGVSIAAVTLFA